MIWFNIYAINEEAAPYNDALRENGHKQKLEYEKHKSLIEIFKKIEQHEEEEVGEIPPQDTGVEKGKRTK